jgi:hypothetical protein
LPSSLLPLGCQTEEKKKKNERKKKRKEKALTKNLINITGADVDPADYAEAFESFKAQGKTQLKF